MPFAWSDLLRSIVNDKYFLKQFLSEEGDVGVFAGDAPDGTQVDVRLARADEEIRRTWSEHVSRSAALSHPHLLRDIAAGDTRIDGTDFTYLVSESIQENLSDVVAERTLTTDETQAVVEAALAALDYLHRLGYTHGGVTPRSIVAAGDAVKLLTSTVHPLPAGDLDSRRAVSGDVRELAAATTEMLTGKREPGAGAQLPSPFKEFVRASFGTEECPSPTAAQLLRVLRGQPLAAANRVSAEQTSVPAPEPVERAPAVAVGKTVRFRPGVTTAVLASLLVLVIAFAAYRLISRDANNDEKLRTRVTDEPPRESTLPSPVVPPKAVPPQALLPRASSANPTWGVIAAAYNDYDAAARRAARLGSRWKHGSLSVFPAKGQGSRYFVVVGLAASLAEAESLLARARAAGMPSDTYVTRLQF